MRNLITLALATILFITSCGAPMFRSEKDRFAEEPDIIDQIRPYLADWSILPTEQTELQRKNVSDNIDGILSITIGELKDINGKYVTVVGVLLEEWGDWSRGYFYVHENGVTLAESENLRYRRLDEHFYIYNSTN